jgi:uncharacterized sporulation protein YeaH/YhbH (DUF444 family)
MAQNNNTGGSGQNPLNLNQTQLEALNRLFQQQNDLRREGLTLEERKKEILRESLAIEKDIAKRFFKLLYMFLTKQYERIEIVFIRHHTTAKEVTEEEFFNSKESGGTVVISALELMSKIIKERYSKDWNIYAAQASDGDVWDKSDANDCYKILDTDILNSIQYMTYIEICRSVAGDLWNNYKALSDKRKNFEIGRINEVGEIWTVFQDFFKKKTA